MNNNNKFNFSCSSVLTSHQHSLTYLAIVSLVLYRMHSQGPSEISVPYMSDVFTSVETGSGHPGHPGQPGHVLSGSSGSDPV